jgi:CspA family cold shock protein
MVLTSSPFAGALEVGTDSLDERQGSPSTGTGTIMDRRPTRVPERKECTVPTGKVKFFDAERGFGFIGGDDGVEVFLHASALPEDVPAPRPGTRVEYGVADGRKGPQALSVRVLRDAPSVSRAQRRKPQAMVPVVEDLIKMLDHSSNALRRGKYPENSHQVAKVLRAVAEDFDA